MRRRIGIALLVASCCVLLGGKCGGGDGGGGGGSIETESPDSNCTALNSEFPPGFDFVPDGGSLIWLVTFGGRSLIPFDVSVVPPGHSDSLETLTLPDDSDGDGAVDSRAALPDDIHIVTEELALVTASGYEEVLFFSPATGELIEVDISVPASFAKADNPRLPDPGAAAEPRTAVSTAVCVKPPPDALDSRGKRFAESLRPSRWCDLSTPSYRSSFTSGAALAGDHLFVSVSNLGNDQGTPDTQYNPGAVLVYDVDWEASPPTLSPSETAPVLITTGFNPSHVTAFEIAGRPFALVTVSGALGVARDDPNTDDIEAAGIANTEASIDVIDANTLEIVATIPLGFAGLSLSGLRVDETARIGVVGSVIGHEILAVDLAPLADPDFPDSVVEPIVLDGLDGDDAVIFDADDPLAIPPRLDGAPAASCPGSVGGVAFDGNRFFVTEACDGTLSEFLVDLTGDPPAPLAPERFKFIDQLDITYPIRVDTLSELRSPGALAVRPGVFESGPDVIYLVGQPEGLVCGIELP
jgi:hypothetical protein